MQEEIIFSLFLQHTKETLISSHKVQIHERFIKGNPDHLLRTIFWKIITWSKEMKEKPSLHPLNFKIYYFEAQLPKKWSSLKGTNAWVAFVYPHVLHEALHTNLVVRVQFSCYYCSTNSCNCTDTALDQQLCSLMLGNRSKKGSSHFATGTMSTLWTDMFQENVIQQEKKTKNQP